MTLFDSKGRTLPSPESVERFGEVTGSGFIPFGIASGSSTRNVSRAVAAYATNQIAWGLVSKVAMEIAKVEWVALERTKTPIDNGQRVATRAAELRTGIINRNADDLIATGDWRLVEKPSRLLQLWLDSNEYMSAAQRRFIMIANYLLAGQAYLFALDRSMARGFITGLYAASPFIVKVKNPAEKDPTQRVYEIRDGDFFHERIPYDHAFAWDALSPSNPYSAVAGFGGAIATELSADESAAQVTANRFANSGTPPGFFTVRSATEAQIQEFRQQYTAREAGRDSGTPLWFGGNGQVDEVKWTAIGETLASLDIEAFRDSVTARARKTLGIPPEIMGEVESSNRATIQHAKTIFAQHVVAPILRQMSDFLNGRFREQFAGDEGHYLSFVDPTPVDTEARERRMDATPDICTVNELRIAAALPELEGEHAEMGEMLYRDFLTGARTAEDLEDLASDDPEAGLDSEEPEDEDDEDNDSDGEDTPEGAASEGDTDDEG